MKIFRTATFTKSLKKMGAFEADLAALELAIAANPLAGDLVPGSGGARKIRFAMSGMGKRGGGRAIYYLFVREDTAYLLLAYAKAQKTDLSMEDKAAIAAFIRELRA